jgi:colanic acid biosynthesis glycosyl transferase WcaI
MGYSQGLETVIEAWRLLDDLPDVRLMMVGDGQAYGMVADALRGDARVRVLPTQAREVLPALLAAADVGLVPLRRGMAATCIPSKVFGIMAAGRAVVAGVEAESETARLVMASDAGLVVPPEDAKALADVIRALYADRARVGSMGAAGRRFVVAHHSRDAIVERYERVLLDAIAEH